jgi:hypothetical protein
MSGALAASRVVITDDPSESIRIVLYNGDGRAAFAPISPARALQLAGQLLAAGARRLDDDRDHRRQPAQAEPGSTTFA